MPVPTWMSRIRCVDDRKAAIVLSVAVLWNGDCICRRIGFDTFDFDFVFSQCVGGDFLFADLIRRFWNG